MIYFLTINRHRYGKITDTSVVVPILFCFVQPFPMIKKQDLVGPCGFLSDILFCLRVVQLKEPVHLVETMFKETNKQNLFTLDCSLCTAEVEAELNFGE